MIKKVLKFGGTSVGSIKRIVHAANIVKKEHDNGNKVIVVVSAMSDQTNKLIGLAKELGLESTQMKKISIFMDVFDCHVNRSPCSGAISEILYKPGKFFNASLDKASEDNERNYYKIKNSDGNEIIVVQIAGLVARRIVTEVSKDELVEQGSRKGMIRFGSRADIYFENYTPLVKINQKTIAGETLIAKK